MTNIARPSTGRRGSWAHPTNMQLFARRANTCATPSAPRATMPSNPYYKRTRRQTRRTRPSALDQIADLPRPVPRPRSLRCDPREHQLVLALHQAQTKAQRAQQAIDSGRMRVPIEQSRNRLEQRVPRPGGKTRARPTFPEKFGTAPPMNQGFLVPLLAAGLAACVDNATGRQWALPPHPIAPGWGRIYVLPPMSFISPRRRPSPALAIDGYAVGRLKNGVDGRPGEHTVSIGSRSDVTIRPFSLQPGAGSIGKRPTRRGWRATAGSRPASSAVRPAGCWRSRSSSRRRRPTGRDRSGSSNCCRPRSPGKSWKASAFRGSTS